jgi:hypothetical protein
MEIEADFQVTSLASVGKNRRVNNLMLTHNTVNGEYFVVWQGNGLPGENNAKSEIFGQRIAPPNSRRP